MYSPNTSATEMSEAESRPERRFGASTRHSTVGHEAPNVRAASDRVFRSIASIDAWIDLYAEEIGPKRGARVVAKSWVDPAFRARLLADGTAAISEFGYQGHATGHLVAVENAPKVHNLVVCTLCSCYPFSLLGMSPGWYKSQEYRARAVRDPRGVLKEFGVALGDDVEIRVWDSTAELRYLVVPERPAGTDGMNEDALATLVTRNSMIGTDRNLKAGA